MGTIGVSGPVTREGTDVSWARDMGTCEKPREGRISIFVFLIESRSFVSIYLPG